MQRREGKIGRHERRGRLNYNFANGVDGGRGIKRVKAAAAVRFRGDPFPRSRASPLKKARPLSSLLNIHEKQPFERALPRRRVAGPSGLGAPVHLLRRRDTSTLGIGCFSFPHFLRSTLSDKRPVKISTLGNYCALD